MTDQDLLCLELSQLKGIGLRRITDLYTEFGSIDKIWNADAERLQKILPDEQVRLVLKGPHPERLYPLVKTWQQQGVSMCTRENNLYPKQLLAIYDAPPVLYYMGDSRLFHTQMMAVVGARKCTAYGRRAAIEIGSRLAQGGYTVVSGMAYGIDACGHEGALRAGGRTIAVLANGVDICYPSDHWMLREQILEQGLLLSEHPPGTEPRAGFFPLRNRIISGLCQGVVIVEAAQKSGSLITADQALEQGRDVYCVPGSVFSDKSCGVHRLVQQGAILLSSMEDLPAAIQTECEMNVSMPAEEEKIYRALAGEGCYLQELLEKTGFEMHILMQKISLMELQGWIYQTEDQRWAHSNIT